MIRMVLEINHHNGEPDLFCPQVFCDWCERRIAGYGNVLYLAGTGGVLTGELFYTHKHCNHFFELTNRPPEGWRWYSLELEQFPLQLAANLGMGDTKQELIATIRKNVNLGMVW